MWQRALSGGGGGGSTPVGLTEYWPGGGTKTVTTPSKAKVVFIYMHANAVYSNILADGTVSETDLVRYQGNAITPYATYTNALSLTDTSATFTVEYNGNYQYRYFILC